MVEMWPASPGARGSAGSRWMRLLVAMARRYGRPEAGEHLADAGVGRGGFCSLGVVLALCRRRGGR